MNTQPIDVETVPKSEGALVVRPQQESVSLFRTDDPEEVVKRATAVATALKDVISKQGLISSIQGKQYPKCEAWTLCGTMLGIFPVLCWSRPVEGGWEARVEARTRSGEIVGAAEAECLKSERNWASREDFAVRSMAQTRATAKALRMPLGFIMTLAGYEATPVEEMPHDNDPPSPTGSRRHTGSAVVQPAGNTEAKAPIGTVRVAGDARPGPIPGRDSTKEVKNANPPATEAQRNKMLARLIEVYGDQKLVKDYAEKAGILLATEGLLDWPLRYVPSMSSQMELLESAIADFLDGDEAKKPFVNPDPPAKQEKKAPSQPDLKVQRDPQVGTWREFLVPFGKNKDIPLGKLEQNSLAWYCRNFVVSKTFPDGTPKSATFIAKDQAFRDALDAAAAETGIEKEEQ